MKHSSLEITEKAYLIKLSKEDFDLPFIHQLLKRIQTEHLFFSKTAFESEEDILSRNLSTDNAARFDRLCDK